MLSALAPYTGEFYTAEGGTQISQIPGVYPDDAGLNLAAQAHLGLGDVDGARAASREGIESARRAGTPVEELQCRLSLARALSAADADAAQEQIEIATSMVDATGAEAYRPFLLIERAALARTHGDESDRERCLTEARDRFAAMPAPIRVDQVEALLRDAG